MTAAELRETYMADTYELFEWLRDKFSISTRAAHKTQAKERRSIKEHTFYYVSQHGEKAKEIDDNRWVLAPLKCSRNKEMEGGAGQNTMDHFDCLAPGKNTAVQLRARPF